MRIGLACLAILAALCSTFALTVNGVSAVSGNALLNAPWLGRFTAVVDMNGPRAALLSLASKENVRSTSESILESPIRSTEGLLAAAPADGELWMALAQLSGANGSQASRTAAILQMSYLTAPAELAIMLARLDVAVSTGALSDPVLQSLAEGDVRAVLLRKTENPERLIEIYRQASEIGKVFLSRTTSAIDPDFSRRMTSSAP